MAGAQSLLRRAAPWVALLGVGAAVAAASLLLMGGNRLANDSQQAAAGAADQAALRAGRLTVEEARIEPGAAGPVLKLLVAPATGTEVLDLEAVDLFLLDDGADAGDAKAKPFHLREAAGPHAFVARAIRDGDGSLSEGRWVATRGDLVELEVPVAEAVLGNDGRLQATLVLDFGEQVDRFDLEAAPGPAGGLAPVRVLPAVGRVRNLS